MTLLDNVLAHNQRFVTDKQYEGFQTTKFPDKKVVIFTCMDTRLSQLLRSAMDINHGDAKFIKNAGAVISHPFGSVMRSILLAVYELKAEEVMVVGHHNCGMAGLEPGGIVEKAKERGVSSKTIETLEFSGIDVKSFLTGFNNVEESVRNSVKMIKNHPLLPETIPVHGLVISPDTGALDLIIDGY
ncbi:beta-class carbonic anhydrase [Halalkalibacter alkalisediminis]|uniref:carbonic anhydrase n=1 Tax=Halalkalibacter alkalisediminis TaxID=935616 RepID=A0ABV6NMQ5_9BACI|nr:carbonic anhydrase [Halalkalibacter alkalisediminis]